MWLSQRFNLDSLLNELAMLVQPRARVPVIVVRSPDTSSSGTTADPFVWCPKFYLKQALHSLLGNAAKFTNTGRITIDASRDVAARTLTIAVRDTGRGIPADKIASLFVFGEQAEARDATVGYGIGLSLVQQVLQKVFHTEARVESAVGAGTTISFTIRLDNPDAPCAAASPAGAPFSINDTAQCRGLIVDDLGLNRRVLRAGLARALPSTWTLDEADNGEAALAMAAGTRYDLVVLDYSMETTGGVLTGAQTAAALAALAAAHRPTAIVGCTGGAGGWEALCAGESSAEEREMHAAGCLAVWPKPPPDSRAMRALLFGAGPSAPPSEARYTADTDPVSADTESSTLVFDHASARALHGEHFDAAAVDFACEVPKLTASLRSTMDSLHTADDDASRRALTTVLRQGAHGLKGVALSFACPALSADAGRLLKAASAHEAQHAAPPRAAAAELELLAASTCASAADVLVRVAAIGAAGAPPERGVALQIPDLDSAPRRAWHSPVALHSVNDRGTDVHDSAPEERRRPKADTCETPAAFAAPAPALQPTFESLTRRVSLTRRACNGVANADFLLSPVLTPLKNVVRDSSVAPRRDGVSEEATTAESGTADAFFGQPQSPHREPQSPSWEPQSPSWEPQSPSWQTGSPPFRSRPPRSPLYNRRPSISGPLVALSTPRPTEDAARDAPLGGAPPGLPPPSGEVLVVDDSLMMRRLTGRLLRVSGHAHVCAANGAEAMELVATSAPDRFWCVLMDRDMPGMNGVEAARDIHAIRPSLLIVGLSADADAPECTAAFRDAGALSVLNKPLTAAGLRMLASTYLSVINHTL